MKSLVNMERVYLDYARRYQSNAELDLKTTLSRYKRFVVSWSGGKCSAVVLDMVRQMFPNVQVFYCDTGVDFPETYRYVQDFSKEFGLNLTWLRPQTTFWKVVETHGFPKRRFLGCEESAKGLPHIPKCCVLLKEKPLRVGLKQFGIELNIGGLRAGESRARMFTIAHKGLHYFNKHYGVYSLHPIGLWTKQQVEHYLKEQNIPINPVYATGQARTGCWTCTAYVGCFETLKKSHPRLHQFLTTKYGMQIKIDQQHNVFREPSLTEYATDFDPSPFY